MHTLFDFISDVYAVQYGLALISIAGFIIMCEVLKPRPFEGLVKSAAEDLRFIRANGRGKVLELARNAAMAPVYFVFYLAAVPVLFAQAIAEPLGRMFVSATAAGWSPVRAYFTGRKRVTKGKKDAQKASSERKEAKEE
ncbi:MAG TPA: hypothetical protein VLD40_06940 [Dissulfurispiraceae bacterium]|jgi:hypothetical protein|nr:hypothetical protein [Dissulfurispiraceae bacterium]